jgi:hypothetical protein
MTHRTQIHSCASTILLAIAALAFAPGLLAAQPRQVARTSDIADRLAPEPDQLRDIALQAGHLLQGQVVDRQGLAQANCEVWVSRESGSSIKTRTDASGRFGVRDLSAGVYRIETAAGGGKFRLWAPKSAPADAQSNVLLVVAARVASG